MLLRRSTDDPWSSSELDGMDGPCRRSSTDDQAQVPSASPTPCRAVDRTGTCHGRCHVLRSASAGIHCTGTCHLDGVNAALSRGVSPTVAPREQGRGMDPPRDPTAGVSQLRELGADLPAIIPASASSNPELIKAMSESAAGAQTTGPLVPLCLAIIDNVMLDVKPQISGRVLCFILCAPVGVGPDPSHSSSSLLPLHSSDVQ